MRRGGRSRGGSLKSEPEKGGKRNKTPRRGGRGLGKKRKLGWDEVPPSHKSYPQSQVLAGSSNCIKAQLRNPEGPPCLPAPKTASTTRETNNQSRQSKEGTR